MKGKDLPKLWAGNTAYVIGGGPSLSKDYTEDEVYERISEDLWHIHDRRVIGVNNAYLLGDWVDVAWFGDQRWFNGFTYKGRKHCDMLQEFGGMKAHCVKGLNGWLNMVYFDRGKPRGMDKRPGFVSWNSNSGTSAINLAYHLGATKVVLVGFDMQRTDGRNNWHKDHQTDGRSNPYDRFKRNMIEVRKDAQELSLEIVNATPGSALDLFPIVTLEETL